MCDSTRLRAFNESRHYPIRLTRQLHLTSAAYRVVRADRPRPRPRLPTAVLKTPAVFPPPISAAVTSIDSNKWSPTVAEIHRWYSCRWMPITRIKPLPRKIKSPEECQLLVNHSAGGIRKRDIIQFETWGAGPEREAEEARYFQSGPPNEGKQQLRGQLSAAHLLKNPLVSAIISHRVGATAAKKGGSLCTEETNENGPRWSDDVAVMTVAVAVAVVDFFSPLLLLIVGFGVVAVSTWL